MSFSVFVRDREIEGSGEREVIIVGGITFTSGPAWAKCYTVCVCVCVSKYSRLVWLLSALTCIPFFSLSTVFLTLSFSWAHFSLTLPLPLGLISPPHPPTQCTQHCKSARQHKCTHTYGRTPYTHARVCAHTHTPTCARKHTHSQREVLLGSAGCVALHVLTLYLLLYLYPLSILYANLCMFTFCILHPHSSQNARRTFMNPLAFILSCWYIIYVFFFSNS